MSDVQSLYREAFRLQALKNQAKDQLLDARLAFEDASRHCEEAWKKYDAAFAADVFKKKTNRRKSKTK